MVGDFGAVYVTDWGLAVALADIGKEDPTTLPGVSGTPEYMAPEQLLGFDRRRIDQRSDVYGLGAILFELLTGEPPHQGRTLRDVVESARKPVAPPETLVPQLELPGSLCEIVRQALATDPAERPATVVELRGRVDHFLRTGGWFPSATFAAGTTIVTLGERDDRAYVILDGRCEIYRGEGERRHVIRTVGPGDVFGEIALFTSAPRTANVRALTATRALIVTRAMLERELDRGAWMRAFIRAAGERYLELDREQTTRERSDRAG
jgi:serine/threonine-protein kinase